MSRPQPLAMAGSSAARPTAWRPRRLQCFSRPWSVLPHRPDASVCILRSNAGHGATERSKFHTTHPKSRTTRRNRQRSSPQGVRRESAGSPQEVRERSPVANGQDSTRAGQRPSPTNDQRLPTLGESSPGFDRRSAARRRTLVLDHRPPPSGVRGREVLAQDAARAERGGITRNW
jgi:hypothetical protein